MHRHVAKNAKRNLCDLCASAVKKCTSKEQALLVYGKNAPPSREERKEKPLRPLHLRGKKNVLQRNKNYLYTVKMHRHVAKNAKRNLCDLCASAVKKCTSKEQALLVYGKNAPPCREERKEKPLRPLHLRGKKNVLQRNKNYLYTVKMHRHVAKNAKRNLCDLCASAVKNCTTKEQALLVYGKNAPPSREERKEKPLRPLRLRGKKVYFKGTSPTCIR
jgi:sulfur transfer protein SufE